ncbi:MAG: type II toxin-antitoxin system HicA family toxin [Ectothiorhodospiraceae bacterium]|nr:type II toxin-antitoxin system HicA family toxin [Ectothiorhodospiraceae bacterium]
MGKSNSSLTCKDVKNILVYLGFKKRVQKGSHEQWVKNSENHRFKVTVDCPKAPFSWDLIKSMASQAGSSKREFLKLHKAIKKHK